MKVSPISRPLALTAALFAGAVLAAHGPGRTSVAEAQPTAAAAANGQRSSPGDRPEPGLQGQTMPGEVGVLPRPYSKGVRVVGHSDLWGRDSNVQLTWVGHCAYVASTPLNFLGWAAKPNSAETSGVAVVDVGDPSHPKAVRLLRDPGAMFTAETMHAADAPDRKVLVAGAYANGAGGMKAADPPLIDIYDVSDCANPKLMAEFKWPENVHAVTVSPNGRHVYGTHIEPFTGKGGLHVLDISDLAHPRYLGKFGVTRPDGTTYEFAPHEISISPDERRIYAGVIASTGGDLNLGVKLFPPNPEGLGPNAGGIYVLDNSDLVEGRPNPKMRLIGTAQHAGWHSAMQARINGTPYLVGAGELGVCPGAWPRITNIADETKPAPVGEFRLAMNRKENCPPPSASEIKSNGISGRPGTAESHFNDVDSATDTRLGLFNFMWAGLRIADLRDPARPVEVAYFKPGDACTGHVRYLPDTGQIWFTCAASGFWVIELRPELRAALGLPKAASRRN
jgi:hypothetical protein